MTTKIEDETQLQALKDFVNCENKEIVEKLEEILNDVAKTGQYIFPWNFMKPLYIQKLDKVTEEFLSKHPPKNQDGSENLEEINNLKNFREELIDSFGKFSLAPFTLQRVTELLLSPKKHYKTTPKFFRGLEKNIMVVSTLEMAEAEKRNMLKRQYENSNGEREDIKPPVKRHTEEFTYYSYGDSNTTGSFHDDMDDDQDDGFADVGGMEEQAQILGQQLENETTPEDVDVHYLNCDKPAVCSELQPDIKPPFEIQADDDLTSNESMEDN